MEGKTVSAVVMEQPNQEVKIHTFQRPALERGAVLLETIYSEVCGTDCHLLHGKLAGVQKINYCCLYRKDKDLQIQRFPIQLSLAM